MTQRIQKAHFTGDEIKLLKNTPKDPKTGLLEPRLEPHCSPPAHNHSLATSYHLEIITSTNADEMLPWCLAQVFLSLLLSLTLYKVIYRT